MPPLTATPRAEERAARAAIRRGQQLARIKEHDEDQRRRRRWRELMALKRKSGCRCEIEPGMTYDQLLQANLRGLRSERGNYRCTGDRWICAVLCRALALTRPSRRPSIEDRAA